MISINNIPCWALALILSLVIIFIIYIIMKNKYRMKQYILLLLLIFIILFILFKYLRNDISFDLFTPSVHSDGGSGGGGNAITTDIDTTMPDF